METIWFIFPRAFAARRAAPLGIKKNELAYSSYRGYESKAESHVRPRWGNVPADKIDHIELQTWIQKELSATLANKTIKEIVSIIR
ncbi:hypothetical protein [Pistricoccus aurantiacus]|uniref:hypothetical protein n=1 Tax=Pistricoccus aurantiacus TaxID=1883414 RepID=UPI001C94DFC6